MMSRRWAKSLTVSLLGVVAWTLVAGAAEAQNYSFDARTVAMGGVGSGNGNIASTLIDEQKPYRSIVIPLGLFQVLRDFDIFNPDSDQFDPVRAGEYAASPIHFVVGRDGTGAGNFFVTDILNGELKRDLNVYQGFVPAPELVAEGLANPSWGKTFKFRQQSGGAFQGIYAGAGPYFSMQTSALFDERLRSILGSDTPVFIPNARFDITNTLGTQMALAITGGYRARVPVAGWIGDLDGLYLAANYNYLKGFRYEAFDTALRLDTDGAGLLTVNPALPAPLRLTRDSSEDGRGFAIDVGAGIVKDHWQFGFGANGLGNRIDWNGIERTLYSLDSLFSGDGDFDDTIVPSGNTLRVELPIDYRGYVAYSTDAWGAAAEWSNGFQGTTFRAGLEKKYQRIELRGGGRFVRDRWEPSGGVGLNLTDRFGVDVAGFGTSANVERERKLAIAISLRLMHSNVQ